MPKDSMPTKEDLQREKAEALNVLKNATDAANALLSKKENSKKPKTETGNSELEELKQMVLKEQANLSTMRGDLGALAEERQKLEKETTQVAQQENTMPAQIISEPEIIKTEPEIVKTEKPKAVKREGKHRNTTEGKEGDKRRRRKDQKELEEAREKVLASMDSTNNSTNLEQPEVENTETNPDFDQDTLEQKVEHFTITGEDINRIAQKRKDKEHLSVEDEALYEQNRGLFEAAIKTKKRSLGSWLAGGYLWLQKKFFVTPKSEKIVITDEEIAENHPEISENNEIKLDESVETKIEPETIEPEVEDKEQTIEPENKQEEEKPKKESNKEREARLKQEFIEKVQNQIDAKMAGEWAGMNENERAEKAKALYLSEKEIFDKEKIERAGIFTKSLHATENWWKNLENQKGGTFWKTAISSGMVGTGIILGGLATGSLEANVGKIAWRLGSRVGLATAFNSMLASNRISSIISTFSPKNQKTLKASKYMLAGAGIAASGLIMSSWLVAGIAAGGYGLRKISNAIKEYSEKKIAEKESSVNNGILKSEDFKDGYDRNKMLEKISLFDEAYTKLAREKRLSARLDTVHNYVTSTGIGLATLIAISPEIAHAENATKVEEVQKDMIQDKNGNWIEKPKFPDTAPTPEPEKIDFTEVKAGDGVSQTLKIIVEKGEAPKWVMDELGKNPTAEDYAKFVEKYDMYKPNDFEDSIKVSKGDSFGFDEKGNFLWKHDGENYTVVKIDEHGHQEEGDWMDKMQDEKFIHSLKNDPTIGEWKGGGAEAVKDYYENQGAGGPTVVDDNDFPESTPENRGGGPTIIGDGGNIETPAGDQSSDGTPAPAEATLKTPPVEKLVIDPNPYRLGPEQLKFIDSVYKESFIEHVFKNEESLKWWNEISNTKNATDFLYLRPEDVADNAQKKLLVVLQSIHDTTKLEPFHGTVLQPEIPNETIKQYILRGLQHAYMNGKLNEINIEARPITI